MSSERAQRERILTRTAAALAGLIATAADCDRCAVKVECLTIFDEATDVPVDSLQLPCGEKPVGRELIAENEVFVQIGREVGQLKREGSRVWK